MKHRVISTLKREPHVLHPGVLKSGVVERESVDDILVDSGCSCTMVRWKLVPECKVKEGEAVAMLCVYGDKCHCCGKLGYTIKDCHASVPA